ncbi:autophagy protein 10 [Heterostelium album PN500]|uniref:Ubiquitin-like-conjugating enzyme ATG10 n=1 Tax=Heterostelium pallidum (strain ATCC 26659 / Pp 5 / PN500) TaxID=670386 RepID=D3AYG1_HETP5|nr:autophagy protein 10 [Heterostelium album PN500]EFA85988.1 autophagy protein 10 [Heterostelium album PN500]|eukprot:XP_020438094.1 autophagy protein 10 [Heterostelium album PN500]
MQTHLTWQQFKLQCERLIELVNQYRGSGIQQNENQDSFNWYWLETDDRGTGCLVLKSIKTINTELPQQINVSNNKDIDIESELEENDIQTINSSNERDITTSKLNQKFVHYEYHISFSVSYQVPVLYLNVYNSDSSFIKWDDIWNLLPLSSYDKSNLSSIPWISQVDHPLLGIPFYQLHPCETANLMNQVLANNNIVDDDKCSTTITTQNHENDYLLSWLSIVGPLVGIRLPKEILILNKNLK